MILQESQVCKTPGGLWTTAGRPCMVPLQQSAGVSRRRPPAPTVCFPTSLRRLSYIRGPRIRASCSRAPSQSTAQHTDQGNPSSLVQGGLGGVGREEPWPGLSPGYLAFARSQAISISTQQTFSSISACVDEHHRCSHRAQPWPLPRQKSKDKTTLSLINNSKTSLAGNRGDHPCGKGAGRWHDPGLFPYSLGILVSHQPSCREDWGEEPRRRPHQHWDQLLPTPFP